MAPEFAMPESSASTSAPVKGLRGRVLLPGWRRILCAGEVCEKIRDRHAQSDRDRLNLAQIRIPLAARHQAQRLEAYATAQVQHTEALRMRMPAHRARQQARDVPAEELAGLGSRVWRFSTSSHDRKAYVRRKPVAGL
jgi:hypothetical protein